MAISGHLIDLSILDILRVTRGKSGVLLLSNVLRGHSIKLNLRNNHLLSLLMDNSPILDKDRVRDVVIELSKESEGIFIFDEVDIEDMRRYYMIPLYPLITQTEFQYDSPFSEDDLPHPSTQFRLSSGSPHVPSSFFATWHEIQAYFTQGCSTDELSRKMKMDINEARTLIYRSRQSGLIELNTHLDPVIKYKDHSSNNNNSYLKEARGIFKNFLSRLRSRQVS